MLRGGVEEEGWWWGGEPVQSRLPLSVREARYASGNKTGILPKHRAAQQSQLDYGSTGGGPVAAWHQAGPQKKAASREEAGYQSGD